MKRSKTRAIVFAASLILSGAVVADFVPLAAAQSAQSASPQTQRVIKTQFVVQRMMYQALQVRDLAAVPGLHTFTYSPGIRDKMQKVFDAGGYQYGDRVVVWYQSGTSVALNIKGRPSKKK